MASLSVKFFATGDELIAFVRRWIERGAIHAAVIEFPPFSASPLPLDAVETSLRRERVRSVIFAVRPVDCSAAGSNELLDKNDGALVLEVGRLTPSGLCESWLSTMNATKAWRAIAADVKRGTSAGMISTHEQSGATGKCRTCRYTQGAAELEQSGTPLRQFAQAPVRLRPDR
ncbi:hypothetical protein L6R52_01380 [Myxococcota bacterium]|nr:hypothetical protein [Myxococcota bacterium]